MDTALSFSSSSELKLPLMYLLNLLLIQWELLYCLRVFLSIESISVFNFIVAAYPISEHFLNFNSTIVNEAMLIFVCGNLTLSKEANDNIFRFFLRTSVLGVFHKFFSRSGPLGPSICWNCIKIAPIGLKTGETFFWYTFFQFQDVNECGSNGSHDCHISAYCVNTPGSYMCSCNQSGFIYNGSMCIGMLPF